jgi:L-ascorbate metabolism protein UlaG (beta-lactamase superfamily)
MLRKNTYRLGDSTVIEPLINSWAVWSDLISPAPYSMHLLNYQIKLLTSYLANPEVHIQACNNPKFVGGPFVAVPAERAGEIRDLLDTTVRVQSKNIEFAKAISETYEYLSREAKGHSLEPFYERLPAALRGYVELVYDYYSHPIMRLMEGLLYESPYYNKELQSLRFFQPERDGSRHFFLTTPRLRSDSDIDWQVPFDDPRIDRFVELECLAKPLGQIGETLGLGPGEIERLLPMLSSDPVQAVEKWNNPEPRIRYLGHACVLVQCNGVSVMTDPWIGVMPVEGGLERISYQDLPEKIDFALITHGHHDHFVPESLLRLRRRIDCLVVPRSFGLFYADTSLKLAAQRLGFKNVIEMDALDTLKLPDGEIVAVPFLGEHSDLAHAKTAYLVRAGRERILFAADSNCLDRRLYEHLRKIIGTIETVFLGMECVGAPLSWLYGALLPTRLQHSQDQSRRTKGSDSEAALALLEAVGAKRVYVYAMGNEPWLQHGMGLSLSEESKQIKEANKVLLKACEKGFLDARRPYGKFDVYL